MLEYNVVVFGATVYGIAAALAMHNNNACGCPGAVSCSTKAGRGDKMPGDVLIIENSMLLGREYIDAMNIIPCNLSKESAASPDQPYTEAVGNLLADLKRRGLIDDGGRLHVFPISGILASYIRNSGMDVLLMTNVVSVKPVENGFIITVFNADGFLEIKAGRIIDTTSEGYSPDDSYGISGIGNVISGETGAGYTQCTKSLCAMLYARPGAAGICGWKDDNKAAVVLEGKYYDVSEYSGEYVLKLNVGLGTGWPEARRKVHEYWSVKSQDVFSGWKIASIASSFSYDFNKEHSYIYHSGKLAWQPSASYGNLLSAFNEGTKCGISIKAGISITAGASIKAGAVNKARAVITSGATINAGAAITVTSAITADPALVAGTAPASPGRKPKIMRYILNNGCVETTSLKNEPVFDHEYDIVVAGLGTTGSMAAICAAESGSSVLGVERLPGMGGIGTYGCVWDYYFGSSGGRFESLNDECREMAEGKYLSTNRINDGEGISGTVKTYVHEKAALDAGCELWYESVVAGAYMEGNRLVGLVCLKDNRLVSIKTKVTIDCTGEAAICRIISAGLHTGRAFDNLGQQYSKAIGMINGDYIKGVWQHCGRTEKFDMQTLSRRIIKAASEPPCLLDNYSGRNRTIYEGAILGIRESAHVITEEYLTLQDHFNGRRTSKPLFYAFSQVDNVTRDIAFESRAYQDWHFICSMYCFGISVGVPLGAMIPKGFDGILAAGKSMGTDHDMASCIRMKKDLEKCGEAAAAAAAAYIKIRHNNVPVKEIPYSGLRDILVKSGCLDESNNYGIADLRKINGAGTANTVHQVYMTQGDVKWLSREGMAWDRTGEYRISAALLTEPSDVKAFLSSYYPGFAYWSVKYMQGNTIIPLLLDWCQSGSEPLASHSAIALGLLGVPEAAPMLGKMLAEKPHIPKMHPIPIYYPDHARVICLLGRLHDSESAEMLLEIVETGAARMTESLATDSYYKKIEDFAYLFVSNAVVSLIEIARADPDMYSEISSRLLKWAERDDISYVISMGGSEMGPALKAYVQRKLSP